LPNNWKALLPLENTWFADLSVNSHRWSDIYIRLGKILTYDWKARSPMEWAR
jgi:hypothetical protein